MGILTGKTVLAFGDSIIDGHLYKKAGFMEFVAEQEGMNLHKYANNGACIMPGSPIDDEGLGGMILEDQIRKAAAEIKTADYVVFDGGTNDAYAPVLEKLGEVRVKDQAGNNLGFAQKETETETFAGTFRKTIAAIRENWKDAIPVYVAVHRLGFRERAVQEALHKIELAVCAEMGVTVADLYEECSLDTANEEMCRKYSFDILKDGLPAPGEKPTGTHPNLEAIKEFYLPFVSETLRRTAAFRFREVHWTSSEESLTLYWELPEKAKAQDRYQIWVNGKLAGETEQCHYSMEGLLADTSYEVRLRAMRGEQELQTVRLFCSTGQKKQRLDITKAPYCAVGDGKTQNTEALQRAFDDCGEGQAVYFPAGTFLTGSLRLHSDMEVYLEEGAVLKGTDEPEDYLPRIWSRFEGTEMECYSGLLNLGEVDHKAGPTSCNVVIRGKGTIEGGGRKLMERVIETERERLKDYLAALGSKIEEYENADTVPGRVRPRLLHICNAQNVSVSGISLKNGASWNMHMIYSENILTYDCRFYSRNVWNGDGWDPDSSKDCTIFGCTFDTGDDAIAIKAGKNPEGNKINRPCEGIRIFDCVCTFGHGIAMGSEMSGGIRDVRIWNCDLEHSANGIEIKGTRKRGGYVRDIHVTNCIVPRILFHSVAYNDDGIAAPKPPVFEKCSFTDIDITRSHLNEAEECMEPCEAVDLCGFEEKEHHLREIVFRNIRIDGNGQEDDGIYKKYCEDTVTFENCTITGSK